MTQVEDHLRTTDHSPHFQWKTFPNRRAYLQVLLHVRLYQWFSNFCRLRTGSKLFCKLRTGWLNKMSSASKIELHILFKKIYLLSKREFLSITHCNTS